MKPSSVEASPEIEARYRGRVYNQSERGREVRRKSEAKRRKEKKKKKGSVVISEIENEV